MKERPILFSTPLVPSVLNGSKTQTRRVCKPAEAAGLNCVIGIQDPRDFGQRPLEVSGSGWFGDEEGDVQFSCPYGREGDRLWVRETHSIVPDHEEPAGYSAVLYKADGDGPYGKWKPSIHMFREHSRILLEVMSVRVERLQDISEADARAEGIIPHVRGGWHWHKHDPSNVDDWHQFGFKTAVFAYQGLWESINGAGSWAANPFVWVVEFKVVMKKVGEL